MLRNDCKENVIKLSKNCWKDVSVGIITNNVSQSGELDWEINDAIVRDMHDRLQ